jgi:hypothetical protein
VGQLEYPRHIDALNSVVPVLCFREGVLH